MADTDDAMRDTEQTRSLRTASLHEESLSQRDIIGQNRSPSRKRPRLDSGARRSMSGDQTLLLDDAVGSAMANGNRQTTPTSDNAPTMPPAATPSKVTINVREPPKANGVNGHAKANGVSATADASPRRESSPIIEIVDTISEDEDEAAAEVLLDDASDLDDRIAMRFNNFPYAENGAYGQAADDILQQQCKGLDFESLQHLEGWLRGLYRLVGSRDDAWLQVFYEHASFWKTIASIYLRVLNKSAFKQQHAMTTSLVESFAQTFLTTFATLCACIMRVDADLVSTSNVMSIGQDGLLSPSFIRAAKVVFNHEKGFIAKVLPALHADPVELRACFIRAFVKACGHHYLGELIKTGFKTLSRETEALRRTIIFLEFAQGLGSSAVSSLAETDGLASSLRVALAESLFTVFETTSRELISSLDKQQDILSVDDRRTFYDIETQLLPAALRLAPGQRKQRFRSVVGRDDTGFEAHLPDVALIVWKIKLLTAYMEKGRMDLRLHGVELLAQELVTFFNNHKDQSQSLRSPTPSPALCYVADYLLKERITEYLFGAASHPQLIQRSSNVIGFLVVTNRFSREQAYLIWRAIRNSPDPRVVTASIPIFTNLVRQLTDFEEHVMFAEIILAEPLSAVSPAGAELLNELLAKLRHGVQDHQYHAIEIVERLCKVPLQLCIELLRILSPAKSISLNTHSVYDYAAEVLAALTPRLPSSVFQALLLSCVETLKACPEDGPAISFAIQSMFRHSHPVPKELILELNFASVLMEDFCDFVSRTRTSSKSMSHAQLNMEICPRLDLILQITSWVDDEIDEAILKRFWSHLVGSDALNNAARDVAWLRLATIAFTAGSDAVFLERHKNLLSPTEIESDLLTAGFFQFAQKLATSQIRSTPLELKEDGSIVIPGLDLIWDAMLRAPKVVSDDVPSQYLISRYLDLSWFNRTTRQAVEKTHIALVQENLARLQQAYNILREHMSDAVNGIDSGTGMLTPSVVREEAEMTFIRAVKFLKKFLSAVRASKEHRPQRSKNIDLTGPDSVRAIHGTSLTIKCSIMRSGGAKTIERVISVGSLNTCQQLYAQLCTILSEYNILSFQVFAAGKRCFLREQPRLSLEDFGVPRSPHFIIREVNNVDDTRRDYIIPDAQSRSAFEKELIDHLDVLYSFLDCNDVAGKVTYDLLLHLPRYPALKQVISKQTASPAELLPAKSCAKSLYTIDCLSEVLHSGNMEDQFLVYGACLLDSVLPSEETLDQGHSLDQDLVGQSVNCLYDFFLAARGKNLSLFEDVGSIQRRTIDICVLSAAFANQSRLTFDAYELALDLATANEAAWKAFASHSRTAVAYEQLLLIHQQQLVRRTAATILQRKMEKWRVESNPIFPVFANFMWLLMASFIPRAVEGASQMATEVFELSTYLLKSLLELKLMSSIDAADTNLFETWRGLLTKYDHKEIVGRDDPDPILQGLSELLRCIMQYFPEQAPAAQKTELTDTIWRKFLFQRLPNTDAEIRLLADQLPVLETNTRTDLVHLIDTISMEETTIVSMCRLMSSIDMQDQPRQVDKSTLLKSPAGYVGLKNLGQTCYMNSLMTQLFMNPMFRAFILSCTPLTDYSKAPLLHETQRLFAIMQNSFASYASAARFTEKIETLTEEKVDVREQMDVDEFMNTLFHRWEEQMPSADLKERLRSVYTGKIVQQIKSKECEHVSEREDTCLAVQCDVQGNTNLKDSLRAYVQGDVMEGDNKYKCERCDRLVDAVKRTCLKEIPDHLMLQLKRFAFDMDTYSRNKINDYFEFPMSIDMSIYKFEHLSNPGAPIKEDIFDLVGVIVHKGQAEHGHYVSYIRARPTADDEAPTWLLFDDADVSIFDPKEMADACFGGASSKETSTFFSSSLKSYNAYMLFYQRRSSLEQQPWAIDSTKNPRDVPVDHEMEMEIMFENRALLRDYSLFDESSREFVRCLLSKLEKLDHNDQRHETQTKVLGAALQYITFVWVKTKDLPGLEEVMKSIQAICASCEYCSLACLYWLMQAGHANKPRSGDILRDLLLKITQPKVRGYFRVFVRDLVRTIRSNTDIYGAAETEHEPVFLDDGAIHTVALLATFIPDGLHYNLRAWDDYFGLLADIAAFGAQECYALISKGALTACFQAMLCGTGQLPDIEDPRSGDYYEVIRSLKWRAQPSVNQLTRLAAMLFQYVDMSAEAVEEEADEARLDWWGDDGVPWTHYEEEILLKFDAKEGGLVWLCEVFTKWNGDADSEAFWPGEIVRCLLDRGKSSLVHGVVDTIKTCIRDYESRIADQFLRSARFVAMCLDDRDLLDDFFKFMKQTSREATDLTGRTDDGYSGRYCHLFWSTVHQISMGRLNPKLDDLAFFDRQFISTCSEWGPILLAYTRDDDLEVGRLAQKLLTDALFRVGQKLITDGVRKAAHLDNAVVRLFWGCDRVVRFHQRDTPWQQVITPTWTIMNECADYLQQADDDDGISDEVEEHVAIMRKLEEIRPWYEALPSRIDVDLDPVQSSDLTAWQGLDIGDDTLADASDLTEISDDEIGSLLNTNIDG